MLEATLNESRPLRCFVSGLDDRDTSVVVERIRELKMEARTGNDIKPASESPREAIHREIRSRLARKLARVVVETGSRYLNDVDFPSVWRDSRRSTVTT
jgi:hypothetical protein